MNCLSTSRKHGKWTKRLSVVGFRIRTVARNVPAITTGITFTTVAITTATATSFWAVARDVSRFTAAVALECINICQKLLIKDKKKNIYIYIYCIHHGCVHHIHHLRLLLLRHHHLHFHGCQERHIREKCVRSYHNCSKSLHQIPGSRERYGQVCCSCSMMLKK